MKLIPLSNSSSKAIVDDWNFERLNKFTWHLDQHRYAARSHPYKKGWRIYMHWDIIGKPPRCLVTDHINRNGLDNRKDNLRITTIRENILNKDWSYLKKRKVYSGYIGVGWLESRQKWQAQRYINGQKKWLGYFETPEEASLVYQSSIDNKQIIC